MAVCQILSTCDLRFVAIRVKHKTFLAFLSYLREFCKQLSGDPQFHYNTGLTTVISPVFPVLGRPFTLAQFSKLALYWAQRYTQGPSSAMLPRSRIAR